MFKNILPTVFSFDVEWIPDPVSAEILYEVEPNPPYSYEESFQSLWKNNGGTEENPQPYIKTILCRIVSICGILREQKVSEIDLKLISLPSDTSRVELCDEEKILTGFLKAVGRNKPQLVGYNSVNADVPIIMQRSIVHGLYGHGFGSRPEKPWEGVDYFSNHSDYHIDLGACLGKGAMTPSLHQAATLSGIPGKLDMDGQSVPEMWLKGNLDAIVNYNEFDAFTTHLLWARVAYFSGLMNADEYEREQTLVRELIHLEIKKGKSHLQQFENEWDRLLEIKNSHKKGHPTSVE